jgi:hypothetical protein
MRIVIPALLLVPAAALASSAFDGTWKGRVNSVKVTGNPDAWVVADGMFTCTSCNPQIKVKADGTDQKVTGHAYYDTVAVKVVDAQTVERTNKLAGKVTGTDTVTVSADGAAFSGKFTDYTGEKPAAFSYSEKLTEANDAGTIVNYKMTDDSFSMSANGQSYNAKFDGKEYPIQGDPGHTLVTLKRIDANTVMETQKRQGKVTDEIRLAAAKDGKTVEVTDKDLVYGQTTTITFDKQ